MDIEEFTLKANALLRHAGLSNVPRPVLVGIIVIGVALVLAGAWHFWPRPSADFVATTATAQETSRASSPATDDEAGKDTIVVDVEGAVANPGLYELPAGARAGDAIEAAGGLTAEAQAGAANLAQKLADGEQLTVPSVQEVQEAPSSAGSSGSGASAGGKININTASAAELQELSGVGPSLSERIVEYRETNGRFEKIEDLQNVSGIGETRFANIKDKIRV